MTHLVFPLRILHNQCFQISHGITVVPREIENNGYAKFWGVNKVNYMVYVKMVNTLLVSELLISLSTSVGR